MNKRGQSFRWLGQCEPDTRDEGTDKEEAGGRQSGEKRGTGRRWKEQELIATKMAITVTRDQDGGGKERTK